MGVFEKIKNLFYDEEVIEVPKEKVNNDTKINNNVENNIIEEPKDSIDNVISERDLIKKETNFKFPIIFEDEDFVEQKKEEKVKEKPIYSRVNEHQTKYKKPTLDREVIKEVIEKPKKFKPSPVISPVYGILDKNYKKEELEKNKNNELEKTKELVINFDTIRQKAYGTLSDDIENELDNKTDKIEQIEKEIDDILVENNLLADLEEPVEIKKIEIEEDDNEYSYSDFGVEYKISEDNSKEEEKITKIQEETTIKTDKKETNNIESSNKKIKENDTKEEKVQDEELTEDLFNLIDSMYDR